MDSSSPEQPASARSAAHSTFAASVAGDPTKDGSPDEIYRHFAPLLRRIAIAKFNIAPAEAQVLVHDIFITYLSNPGSVRGELRPYFVGAICNASRNYWRKRLREQSLFSGIDESYGCAELGDDVFADLGDQLDAARILATLGERCREALLRCYRDRQETSDIAAALGTSCGNVYYILHACRKRARALYDDLTRVRV